MDGMHGGVGDLSAFSTNGVGKSKGRQRSMCFVVLVDIFRMWVVEESLLAISSLDQIGMSLVGQLGVRR